MNKYGVVFLFILGMVVVGMINRSPRVCALLDLKGVLDPAGVQAVAVAENKQPSMSLPSQVVVYYFHGNARCPSCYKLEQYAKEAVEQNFAEELKAGSVIFRKINVDQRENRHFVNDYQLYTKSVVISLVKDGRQVKYKNLDKIWGLLGDPGKYHDYVRDELKLFLGEL